MLALENLGLGVGLLVGEGHTLGGESTTCGLWLRSLSPIPGVTLLAGGTGG